MLRVFFAGPCCAGSRKQARRHTGRSFRPLSYCCPGLVVDHWKIGLGRAKASFSAVAHSALALDNVCRCRSVHYPYPYQQGSKLETCLEARKHRLVRILSHTRNVIIVGTKLMYYIYEKKGKKHPDQKHYCSQCCCPMIHHYPFIRLHGAIRLMIKAQRTQPCYLYAVRSLRDKKNRIVHECQFHPLVH